MGKRKGTNSPQKKTQAKKPQVKKPEVEEKVKDVVVEDTSIEKVETPEVPEETPEAQEGGSDTDTVETPEETPEAPKSDEEAPEESAAEPEESSYVNYIETENEDLNNDVNSKLNTYARHLGTVVTPALDLAVGNIKLLSAAITAILTTKEDADFESAWGSLVEAVADKDSDNALAGTLLSRGAHNDEGVPSITDSMFQLLILLGMEEGSSINLEPITKGLPENVKERLMNFYSA